MKPKFADCVFLYAVVDVCVRDVGIRCRGLSEAASYVGCGISELKDRVIAAQNGWHCWDSNVEVIMYLCWNMTSVPKHVCSVALGR